MNIAKSLQAALALHQTGQFDAAEAAYRDILRADPTHADAHHLTGLIAFQRGDAAGAVRWIQKAIALSGNYAAFHLNLGAAFFTLRRHDEAIAAYREAARLDPNSAEACRGQGRSLRQKGHLHEAAGALRKAVARLRKASGGTREAQGSRESKGSREAQGHHESKGLRPEHAEILVELGHVLRETSALDEAAACYEEAIALSPNAALYNALGSVQAMRRKFAPAILNFNKALALAPNDLAVRENLNAAYQEARDPNAVDELHRATLLPQTYASMADLEASLRETLRLCAAVLPDQPARRAEIHARLARLLESQCRTREAAEAFDAAIRLAPNTLDKLHRATLLPQIYASMEDLEDWRRRFIASIRDLQLDNTRLSLDTQHAVNVFYLVYQGRQDRPLAEALARLHVPPPPVPPPSTAATVTTATPRRGRIRIGFVSACFFNQTIGELMHGIIAHLSREAFEVTVFALATPADQTNTLIRNASDRYVDLPANARVARQVIRKYPQDILFYPDIGMDPVSYTLAFDRLAPVQCVTWGHPITTGLASMDYYLSSELFETPEADDHYTETLVRMKSLPYVSRRPEPPAQPRGKAYFGLPEHCHLYACPQSLFKLHPEFDALIAGILRRDPHGVVTLNDYGAPGAQAWRGVLEKRFTRVMPDVADRIRFLPRLDYNDYLSLNLAAEVLLDTTPFNGGNTSLKALALGVPIVTLPTSLLRGRLTLGLYRRMGMLDCVARDANDYIDIAVRLGTDARFRRAIQLKILATHGVLFDNLEPVRELEQFFSSVVDHHAQGGHASS